MHLKVTKIKEMVPLGSFIDFTIRTIQARHFLLWSCSLICMHSIPLESMRVHKGAALPAVPWGKTVTDKEQQKTNKKFASICFKIQYSLATSYHERQKCSTAGNVDPYLVIISAIWENRQDRNGVVSSMDNACNGRKIREYLKKWMLKN